MFTTEAAEEQIGHHAGDFSFLFVHDQRATERRLRRPQAVGEVLTNQNGADRTASIVATEIAAGKWFFAEQAQITRPDTSAFSPEHRLRGSRECHGDAGPKLSRYTPGVSNSFNSGHLMKFVGDCFKQRDVSRRSRSTRRGIDGDKKNIAGI